MTPPDANGRLANLISHTDATVQPLVEASLNAAFPERVAPHVAEFLLEEWEAATPIRAVLLRLGGEAAGHRFTGQMVTAAVALELVQLATLVIDDVLDRAEVRNGRSCPAVFGSGRAITIGEILKSRASSLLIASVSRSGPRRSSIEALRLFEQMYGTVNLGQFLDLSSESTSPISEAQYFATIKLGTGSFLKHSIALGLTLASAAPRLKLQLEKYGECLGMALQLYDDILDLLPARMRIKPFAGDLKTRKQRLPLLHLLRAGSRAQRQGARQMLQADVISDRSAIRIVQMMLECGSLAYTYRHARRFEKAAVRSLEKCLPRHRRGPFQALVREIRPDLEDWVNWRKLQRVPDDVLSTSFGGAPRTPTGRRPRHCVARSAAPQETR